MACGLLQDRAEFGYRKGVDYVPGEVEADWRPAIDGADALAAVNALVTELGLRPSPIADPVNWRRYRLHGRVLAKIIEMSPADRATLKLQMAGRALSPNALDAAKAVIDNAFVPERFGDV